MKQEWIKKKDKYHVWWECPICGIRLMTEPKTAQCPHIISEVFKEEKKNAN